MMKTSRVITSTILAAAALAWSTTRAVAEQRTFDTPEAGAKALIEATRADDTKALLDMVGPEHADLFETAGPEHRERFARFAKVADEYLVLRPDGDDRRTLVVGYGAWPFPIPLVKAGSTWRFDTTAGRDELLARRIGSNELAVIDTLHAYVIAQRQYAEQARDGSDVREFARKLRSSPGKHDGLYWDADPAKGEEPSPVGPLLADDERQSGEPYYGYRFKILTRQGPAAPASRYDYVINGHMIAGFAMVAYPAVPGLTGVKTFIVNHYDVVYEKDLGPSTPKTAAAMTAYDPDAAWTPVRD